MRSLEKTTRQKLKGKQSLKIVYSKYTDTMVLEFAAKGDLVKLREACTWLKLSELAHVRGKIDI